MHDERMWSVNVADKNEEWHSNVFPLVFNEKARREEWDKQLPFRTSIFLLFPSFPFLLLEFHPLQEREDQHVYDTPSSWLTSLVLKECHEKHKKWRETLRLEKRLLIPSDKSPFPDLSITGGRKLILQWFPAQQKERDDSNVERRFWWCHPDPVLHSVRERKRIRLSASRHHKCHHSTGVAIEYERETRSTVKRHKVFSFSLSSATLVSLPLDQLDPQEKHSII